MVGDPQYLVSGDMVGLAASYRSNSVNYLHTDHLGSPAAATDASGNLLWERREYPFGDMRIDTGVSGTERLFTGQVEDSDAGLYFYNARYLETGMGRFISPDTIVPNPLDPRDHNRYTYVRNNPLKYTDPSGHGCVWVINSIGYSGRYCSQDVGGINIYLPEQGDVPREVEEALGRIGRALVAAACGWFCPAINLFSDTVNSFAGDDGNSTPASPDPDDDDPFGDKLDRARNNALAEARTAKAKPKHVEGDTQSGSKFLKHYANSRQFNRDIQRALTSDQSEVLWQADRGTWKIVLDLGRTIGTRGQTRISVIINEGGKISSVFLP